MDNLFLLCVGLAVALLVVGIITCAFELREKRSYSGRKRGNKC